MNSLSVDGPKEWLPPPSAKTTKGKNIVPMNFMPNESKLSHG